MLVKKTHSRVSSVPRYVILDGKELKFYFNRSEVGEVPLCTIPLKGIYSVMALED